MKHPDGIVLVLGSGGARGLAHAGVLNVLDREGIAVRAIAGTSIGAAIGAFYAAGVSGARLKELARSLDWVATLQLLAPSVGAGGFTSGGGIHEFVNRQVGGKTFAELAIPFAAVATDVESGSPVTLTEGRVVDAVRASAAIPGVMVPYRHQGRLLGDGGLVDPVPVDVAQARFGGPVVAVAVHPGAVRRFTLDEDMWTHWLKRMDAMLPADAVQQVPLLNKWLDDLRALSRNANAARRPSASQMLSRSMDIVQARMVNLILERSPPDLLLVPEVGDISMLEFYNGDAAVAAGEAAAEQALATLRLLARGDTQS